MSALSTCIAVLTEFTQILCFHTSVFILRYVGFCLNMKADPDSALMRSNTSLKSVLLEGFCKLLQDSFTNWCVSFCNMSLFEHAAWM